jgi:hypothetical protein
MVSMVEILADFKKKQLFEGVRGAAPFARRL